MSIEEIKKTVDGKMDQSIAALKIIITDCP